MSKVQKKAAPLPPVIKNSGLSVAEYAFLLGVSRVTVHNWLASRSGPHSMLRQRVERAGIFLAKLVERKALPMSLELDRPTRSQKMEKLKKAFDSFCIA